MSFRGCGVCIVVLTLTFGEYIGHHTGVTLARRLTLLLLLAVTLASAFAQTGVLAQQIRRRIYDQYLFTYLMQRCRPRLMVHVLKLTVR